MYTHLPKTLAGYHIQTNDTLVQFDKLVTVPRTWQERLRSLPWRPWVSTKQIPVFKPLEEYYLWKRHGVIVGHPETINALIRTLNVRERNPATRHDDMAQGPHYHFRTGQAQPVTLSAECRRFGVKLNGAPSVYEKKPPA